MLIEIKAQPRAPKILSCRADDEAYYSLAALSLQTGSNQSTLLRLAINKLLTTARTLKPTSLEQLLEATW